MNSHDWAELELDELMTHDEFRQLTDVISRISPPEPVGFVQEAARRFLSKCDAAAEALLTGKENPPIHLSTEPIEGGERMKLEKKGPYTILDKELSRRTFLKATAATAAAAGVVMSGGMKLLSPAEAAPGDVAVNEQTFITTCRSNCNFGCSLKAHVRDGIMHKVSISPFPDEDYTSICLKGLTHVQRTYSPHRLKYPMRRVGERGSDQWERISWDDAMKEVGEKLGHIRDTYGGKSIVVDIQSGNYGLVNGLYSLIQRLGNCIGVTKAVNCADVAAGHGVHRVLECGDWLYSNEPKSLLDAKMIIIWGTNPVYTAPHVWRFMQMAKERGTKIVCIDPMCSATAHKSDQYIPVVAGSDTYVVLAMSNYIIENNLTDETFLKNRSNAPFLVRRDNGEVLTQATGEDGKGTDYYVWDPTQRRVCLLSEATDVALEGSYTVDGVQTDTCFTLLKNHLKQYTIAGASEISGIPEETIRELAREYATIGPVTINVTYGIDHYQSGHLFFHAGAVMATLTGNLGRPGAGFSGVFAAGAPTNSVAYMYPKAPVPVSNIPAGHMYEVWRDQALFGKPYPLKAIITGYSNSVSNYVDQNRWFTDVLPNLDYWIVVDNEMTDTARYADLVLPSAFWFEVFDFRNIYNSPYLTIGEQAIEPLYECKSDCRIFSLIGHAMGYGEEFPLDYTDEDWGKLLLDSDGMRALGITWEALSEKKMMRFIGEEGTPVVRGNTGRFATSHGRARIYWENPAPRLNYGQEFAHLLNGERLPYFRPPEEAWPENPLFKKYPLVFLQEHARFRTHSQWYSVPMLKELDPEPVAKMSREDADSRGIQNGDIVEVYNDRGHAVVKAVIDDSISAGVLSIPKGWQRNQFIAGCYQELTRAALDPMAVAFAYYDALVDVRKWVK